MPSIRTIPPITSTPTVSDSTSAAPITSSDAPSASSTSIDIVITAAPSHMPSQTHVDSTAMDMISDTLELRQPLLYCVCSCSLLAVFGRSTLHKKKRLKRVNAISQLRMQTKRIKWLEWRRVKMKE
eukprot:54101_1